MGHTQHVLLVSLYYMTFAAGEETSNDPLGLTSGPPGPGGTWLPAHPVSLSGEVLQSASALQCPGWECTARAPQSGTER